MAKANPETIILTGDPIMSEGKAVAAIAPGSLLKRAAAGVAVQTVTGVGGTPPTFAKENDIAGDGIEHSYAATETVLFFTAYGGMVVNARLKASQTIVVGDGMSSGAGGQLQKVASGAVPIAIAIQAVTTTSAQGGAFIKVEIV